MRVETFKVEALGDTRGLKAITTCTWLLVIREVDEPVLGHDKTKDPMPGKYTWFSCTNEPISFAELYSEVF